MCVCVYYRREIPRRSTLFFVFSIHLFFCGALRLVEADRILLERLNVVTVFDCLLRRAVCRL